MMRGAQRHLYPAGGGAALRAARASRRTGPQTAMPPACPTLPVARTRPRVKANSRSSYTHRFALLNVTGISFFLTRSLFMMTISFALLF